MAIALPALSLAGPADDENGAWKKIFNLLPPGSELKDVMFPRYDPDRNLTSVLKAGMMTLVSEEQIEGKTIAIEFFNPDSSTQGRIDLTRALIDKTKGMLTTDEPVEIRIDGLKANGTGLYYDFEKGNGFLLGPATTVIRQVPKTAMNTIPARIMNDSSMALVTKSSSPSGKAIALAGMSLLTQSLLAAPPPAITEAQLAAIRADAASRAPVAQANAEKAKATLDKDLAESAAASEAVANFLVQADLPAIKPAPEPDEAKPLDIKPGPDATVVTCDGGIYFDPNERVLVYLKNVKVRNPDFNMTGRIDELKVFFGEKEVDEKDKEKDKENAAKAGGKKDKDKGGFAAGAGNNIGKPERVVATGAIIVDAKPEEGEEPVQASGAIFTYNVISDEGIISGGWPWVRQGAKYLKSLKHDNLLRIYPKQNRFDTSAGGWEMGGPAGKLKE